ncbi:5-(carboxyamino)imidazole ribonucleotide mutase [Bacteroidetes/Chlorobi group bacterium ChocPot_Mid]|jgi:5-(carboxyamino)imidazole ribonucleotide mutase|nr:MAG: 5-(carboxyamino)imidazole ribonucleotide mutase [Bacteroidetes/Chlorobi group bacterium ChocPot_Mid]
MKNWPPKVSILMGSDSDLPVMKKACEVCDEFGIGYEMRVISAHRNPLEIMDYAQNVHKRGIKVIIAGAGGAAHLPGVIAGNTALPVIGVPVSSKINGLDSLLSIVQMPPGVPVACVAIDGAKNAGLLAMQILATGDEALLNKYINYKKKIAEESAAKNKNPEFTELYKP